MSDDLAFIFGTAAGIVAMSSILGAFALFNIADELKAIKNQLIFANKREDHQTYLKRG